LLKLSCHISVIYLTGFFAVVKLNIRRIVSVRTGEALPHSNTLIRNVQIVDGTGSDPVSGDVAIADGVIESIGDLPAAADHVVDGGGKFLAPGFIDAHTHDDLYAIRCPDMLPKLSQGVTTVIVGNCGISGAPVQLKDQPPAPLNLLGDAQNFRYGSFREYVAALQQIKPAVNVAALVGHTSLRNNVMDRLDRTATPKEIATMRAQLEESLEHGALGLSTGLAYSAANSATTEEVIELCAALTGSGAIYATHIRTESDGVVDALQEAIRIGKHAKVSVVVSHLKCAGIRNWKRNGELLRLLEKEQADSIGWDVYPYAASSTILDLKQVDERIEILITWSNAHPELSGKKLADIARAWGVTQAEAAQRLQPAGAIYHSMSENDVRAILSHPRTMIGSDGLPNDEFPHPRLWGTFPRVLGHYAREQRLFPIAEAVRKMTSLPARRFGLKDRGLLREGNAADLVLFNADTVRDTANFIEPMKASAGIDAVWVNGVLSYWKQASTGERAGRFLARKS
jgi:N-acyl-D-amino-acid deacylase